MADIIELKNRIVKNQKKRVAYLQQLDLEAYRLYDRDIPAYPFIIDVYGPYFFIFEKGSAQVLESVRLAHQQDIATVLKEVFSTDDSYLLWRKREVKKGKQQYVRQQQSGQEYLVQEGGLKFIIKLHDYLDVGLFLDHRPIRFKLRKMAKGRRVLNMFAYTGSVSVYAAAGGASLVVSVDKSKNYLSWARQNFIINKLDDSKHQFIATDAMSYLKDSQQEFDIIFIDPPTFSNEKKKGLLFEVEKDQEELITLAMQHLNKKGILFFSTNKRSFKLSTNLLDKFIVRDISLKTIPLDFSDKKIHYCFQFQHKES